MCTSFRLKLDSIGTNGEVSLFISCAGSDVKKIIYECIGIVRPNSYIPGCATDS